MKCYAVQLWSSVLVLLTLVGAQKCSYQCESCRKSMYYEYDARTGSCTRNDEQVRYFLIGPVYCRAASNRIYEKGSCSGLESALLQQKFGSLFDVFNIQVDWNDSLGCQVEAHPPSTWISESDFSTPICFGEHDTWLILACLVFGVVCGLALAFISFRFERGSVNADTIDEASRVRKDFWLGAKLMAADHIVKGGGTRRLALLFRCSQVVANAWLPMTLVIIMNPLIVLSLYFMLYVIPAAMLAGSFVIVQPIYLITPPDASLFGIDHIQPDVTRSYLFSAVRPFLMIGLVWLVAYILKVNLPIENEGMWTYNASGFFRAGLTAGPGPLVLDFVLFGTALGTIIHIVMTIAIVIQAWVYKQPSAAISLIKNESKCNDVTALAEKICEVAADLQYDSKTSSYKAMVEDEICKWSKLEKDGVQPLSRRTVYTSLALAVVDLSAYAYKIYVFFQGGRYFLAWVIMIALSESFVLLYYQGSIGRAPDAFRRAAQDGVATFDYLSCCQWDDGLAGVPYLMTTIYGLPIAGSISTWTSTLSAILFICTGTRAMGKFIRDAVDSDMFDVHPPKGIGDREERGTLLACDCYSDELHVDELNELTQSSRVSDVPGISS